MITSLEMSRETIITTGISETTEMTTTTIGITTMGMTTMTIMKITIERNEALFGEMLVVHQLAN